MSRLAFYLAVGLVLTGLALISYGLSEDSPEAEKVGEELLEEALEATV